MKGNKVDFRSVTDSVCAYHGCGRHLKVNLLRKIPGARMCYEHYRASIGRPVVRGKLNLHQN
jgi:hypothetical protein